MTCSSIKVIWLPVLCLAGVLAAVLGQGSMQWMQAHIHNAVEKSPALWCLVATSFSIPVGLLVWRKLRKAWAYRAPCPNKQVKDGEPEVIIVGGGVMGSSLAAALGMDGRRVTVIERDMTEPDRFVGEYLQPGGVATLRELLLEDCLEDIDAQTNRGFLFRDLDSMKHDLVLPIPHENVSPVTFHQGRFVQQLRKTAMANDTVTYIEGTVLEVLEEAGAVTGVRYRQKSSQDEQVLTAPLVVVADGIHSKFRKPYTKDPPSPVSHLCGFRLPSIQPQKFMEVIVTDFHMIFLYKVDSTGLRLIVDMPTQGEKMPADLKGYLRDVVSPKLPVNVTAPFLKAIESGDIKVQVSSWMPPNPVNKPGLMVLGDALNIRHPITGTGMTAALNDTLLTRNMLRKIPNLYDYNAVTDGYSQLLVERKWRTYTMDFFAITLFRLFTTDDEHVIKMKRGLVQYFDLDGFPKNGAIGLMSILTPHPCRVMIHLIFAVIYGIWRNFINQGIFRFPLACCQAIATVYKSFITFGPYIWDEIKTLF